MRKNSPRNKLRFIVLLSFSIFLLLSVNSFADDILSRSVVVLDASTGKMLYAKNPSLRRHPASTTKLMTSIIAVENTSLSGQATISRNASHVQPHKAGFKEGDQVTVEQLLYAALLGSANDAAVALSETVAGSEENFVALMNNKAIDIGAEDTRFVNSNGLPGNSQYTTAYDLARIMRYALKYQTLRDIIGTRVTDITTENGDSIFLKNTNKLLWSEEDILGGKTGYTRKAMHCFVCAAERNNHTVIVAILGSPSRDNLWKESEMLISKGFELLENNGEPVIYTTSSDSDLYADVNEKNISKKKKAKRHTKKLAKKKSGHRMLADKRGKNFLKSKQYKKKNYNLVAKRRGEKAKG